MARKVFISFLGTNNYIECIYKNEDRFSEPVRFVQEALIADICKDWSENDYIYIFCTSKEKTGENGSKEINWFDNGQNGAQTEKEKIGLEHCLQNLRNRIQLKPHIEEVDIAVGFSEEEIWDIFNTVFNKLQNGDKIYLDVTHAFRSIPLFSIVLFNYSKFMLDTQLISITYGAFEKLGPTYKAKEIPIDERIVSVIDMTNVARLQEYNQIASNLKEFGKVKKLQDAIKVIENASDQTIRDLGTSISQLDEYIATIDIQNIKKGSFITKFRNNYKNIIKKKKLDDPINKILVELQKETADFVSSNSFKNIEVAINWTIKHDMLMQAYPLAEEYIILRIAEMVKEIKPRELSMKQFRIFISSLLGMPENDFNMKNWRDNLAIHSDVADELSEDFLVKEIRASYNKIREARNSLAHGNGSITYKELKERIPFIVECINYLNSEYERYPSTKYILDNYVHQPF